MHLENRGALLCLRIIETLPLRHGNPITLGEQFHRFREGQVIVFHHELEHVAARVAAEALIDLKSAMYAERRRLLRMKWTKADVSGPAP